MPFTHERPMHDFPHMLQFASSAWRSTHLPEQFVFGAAHIPPHMLDMHVAVPPSGSGHALPHPPQFFGSVTVSTHIPLHSFIGDVQPASPSIVPSDLPPSA